MRPAQCIQAPKCWPGGCPAACDRPRARYRCNDGPTRSALMVSYARWWWRAHDVYPSILTCTIGSCPALPWCRELTHAFHCLSSSAFGTILGQALL